MSIKNRVEKLEAQRSGAGRLLVAFVPAGMDPDDRPEAIAEMAEAEGVSPPYETMSIEADAPLRLALVSDFPAFLATVARTSTRIGVAAP